MFPSYLSVEVRSLILFPAVLAQVVLTSVVIVGAEGTIAMQVALDSVAPWINKLVHDFEMDAGEASQLKTTAEEISMKLLELGLVRDAICFITHFMEASVLHHASHVSPRLMCVSGL